MLRHGSRHRESGKRIRGLRQIAALALIAGLLAPVPSWAQSSEESWYTPLQRGADLVFDVVVLRPVTAIGLAVSATMFIPAAILAAPSGMDMVEEGWERFVQLPAQELWDRPLGEF